MQTPYDKLSYHSYIIREHKNIIGIQQLKEKFKLKE
jgi:hypothetical protein